MLPAPPYFAACLHDSRHCTTVGVASSNFYEDGDSQHPRLQPIPSCLRRTFSNRATGSYPVFSVKLKTGGKIRVVPCSTVWLCQSGTRQAPLFTKNGTTFIRTSTPFITNDGARHPDFAHYPNYLLVGTSCALHTSNCLLLPSNATSDRVANNALPLTKYVHAYYL